MIFANSSSGAWRSVVGDIQPGGNSNVGLGKLSPRRVGHQQGTKQRGIDRRDSYSRPMTIRPELDNRKDSYSTERFFSAHNEPQKPLSQWRQERQAEKTRLDKLFSQREAGG